MRRGSDRQRERKKRKEMWCVVRGACCVVLPQCLYAVDSSGLDDAQLEIGRARGSQHKK